MYQDLRESGVTAAGAAATEADTIADLRDKAATEADTTAGLRAKVAADTTADPRVRAAADITAGLRARAATGVDTTADLKVRAEDLRIHKMLRIPEEKGARADDITEES